MTPHQIADEREKLSAEYSRMSEQLMVVLEDKPFVWEELRKQVKSDTAAERSWEKTADGRSEMRLRMMMKSNQQRQSALSAILRVKENEAKNIW